MVPDNEPGRRPGGRPGWCGDDERLLAELGEAVRAAREVPPRFVEVGKAAFTWRDVDSELAELTLDTADTGGALAGMRSESASLRALTFVADRLSIEIELSADTMVGQVVPPQTGEIEVCSRDHEARTVPVDGVGWFSVRPVPTGMFRLLLRTGQRTVRTEWVTL